MEIALENAYWEDSERVDGTWWFTFFRNGDLVNYQIVDESRSGSEKPVRCKECGKVSGVSGNHNGEIDNNDGSARMNLSESDDMAVADVTSEISKKMRLINLNGDNH